MSYRAPLPNVPGCTGLEELGSGGSGVVFRARWTGQDAPVALKVLHPGLDAALEQGFLAAAERLASLRHPNLVAVHGWGRSAEGRPYALLELVDGPDLADLLYGQGPRPWPEVAALASQLAAALAVAHAAGLVHGDLKPTNVLLAGAASARSAPRQAVATPAPAPALVAGEYVVKLLDFGLTPARVPSAALEPAQAGQPRLGLPEYWSPEQARCEPIDGRSDLYSLGVLCFELLSGRTPFRSHSYTDLIQVHERTPPAAIPLPPGAPPLPTTFERAVLRCLARRPADRFADAGQLVAALAAAAGEHGPSQSVPAASGANPMSAKRPSGSYSTAPLPKPPPPPDLPALARRPSGASDVAPHQHVPRDQAGSPASATGSAGARSGAGKRVCPVCNKVYDKSTSFCSEDGTLLKDSDVDLGGSSTDGQPQVGGVLGAYRLVQVLGEGGMGRVFLAEHTRLGRQVALKLMRPEYAANPKAVKRFFGEARVVNQINHENIIEITDFIEEGEHKYYIMELLRGRSADELLAQEGPPPLKRTLGVAVQVCNALQRVHEAGIVHRDLKPDNIFLIERGGQHDVVKLLDFGVAKLHDEGGAIPTAKTSAGAILGTPEYMSPEQVSGRADVDYRTDIYAFGVILYELVTGAKPFMAPNFGDLVIKHLTVAPPRPSKAAGLPHAVPAALDELILACLEKDPSRRPQSMAEVEERLRALARSQEVTLETYQSPALARRRRWRWVAAAAGLAAVLGVVAALAGTGGQDRADQAAAPGQGPALAGPTAEAAAPATVTIRFESVPDGAEVLRAGADQPLGVTPFELPLPRAEQAELFTFRLPEHDPASLQVRLDASGQARVVLNKHEARQRPRRAATSRPRVADQGAVLDPFAE